MSKSESIWCVKYVGVSALKVYPDPPQANIQEQSIFLGGFGVIVALDGKAGIVSVALRFVQNRIFFVGIFFPTRDRADQHPT